MKKVCIFISDEGFGHVIRQTAIISILLKKDKNLQITVVTNSKINLLKEKFENKILFDDYHNNITTIKNKDSSLNIKKTKNMFDNWRKKSDGWISRNKKKYSNYDLFISDFVPDAFKLAMLLNIPCIGVAHFTWDWFYGQIYSKKDKTYKHLTELTSCANKLYFPPFTPSLIIKKYKNKIKKINFILSDFKFQKKFISKKRCLIMDNGEQNLRNLIIKTIPHLSKIKEFEFIIRTDNLTKKIKKVILSSNNLIPVSGLKNTHAKIMEADIIIARGGFNTISECLSLKKPSILFNEKNNPEIHENLANLKKHGYTSLMNINDWGKNFEKKIKFFYQKDFDRITVNLKKKNFLTTGPAEIYKDIDLLLKNKYR
jgi:uncharacterized protein (TIGR00661 family)